MWAIDSGVVSSPAPTCSSIIHCGVGPQSHTPFAKLSCLLPRQMSCRQQPPEQHLRSQSRPQRLQVRLLYHPRKRREVSYCGCKSKGCEPCLSVPFNVLGQPFCCAHKGAGGMSWGVWLCMCVCMCVWNFLAALQCSTRLCVYDCVRNFRHTLCMLIITQLTKIEDEKAKLQASTSSCCRCVDVPPYVWGCECFRTVEVMSVWLTYWA